MKNQTHFASRIGVRAVVAGMMTTSALLLLIMFLVAALGLWNFRLRELPFLSATFWMASSMALTVSIFAGGLMAASGSRSSTISDGIINALVVCSGCYLFFSFVFVYFASNALMLILESVTPDFFLKIFMVCLTGFIAAVLGGIGGVRYEQKIERQEKNIYASSY
ncbi:MAG: hypothetical protein WC635_06220 [Bacteriovorax sp.]|jgi:hypothetical protein